MIPMIFINRYDTQLQRINFQKLCSCESWTYSFQRRFRRAQGIGGDIILLINQSFTSNWPRVLWLAVDQTGLHLLEHRSRNALCTYDYSSILSYSRALNCLMIITGTDRKQRKVILTTAQAFQIATLIREYMAVLFGESIGAKAAVPLNKNGRPDSSLHSNALLVPPQPS